MVTVTAFEVLTFLPSFVYAITMYLCLLAESPLNDFDVPFI